MIVDIDKAFKLTHLAKQINTKSNQKKYENKHEK